MTQEPPNVSQICTHADKRESRFEQSIQKTDPRKGMIWYSEVFIFSQVCELMDCSQIVESGRYRGFSTEVLATYFEDSDVNIISVEKEKGTENAAIAEQKLNDYEAVELRYGDSRTDLPSIVDESTGVVIDGPKGDDALVLALQLLEKEAVPFVAVHDLHKDHFYRELSEMLFNHRLYTDVVDLVDRFQQYDSTYFEWNKRNSSPGEYSGPYLKNGVESASYGPTLGIFFNSETPFDERIRENYLEYLDDPDMSAVIREHLRTISSSGGPISRRISKFGLRLGRMVLR